MWVKKEIRYNEVVKTRWIIGALITASLLLGTWTPTRAQSTDPRYFSETGHFVGGEFLKYYNSVKDAQMLFGFPITEEIASRDRKTVQYFQRVRMEYRPEMPEGRRITLTHVGSATYVPGRQLNIDNPFACRKFSETGYAVCYAFLDFYEKYGGAKVFGNPISPFEDHDGLIVQYFENARFEWKPWLPEGQKVGLAHLGRIYFDKIGEDPNYLPPLPPGSTVKLIELHAHAFAWKAVTLATDQQLIYIIVQDQNLFPVNGAQGTATVRWPTGQTETFPIATNTSGLGILPLSFTNLPYGTLVYVDVVVSKDGVVGKTTTSFRIWY